MATAFDAPARAEAFPESRLAGNANLLIMPNLDTANITMNLLKQSATACRLGRS